MANETTTKFRVDISDLKKAMQEAKRSVAVANSEFKAVSSSMDDWTKSTEGVQAKLKQLDSVLDAQKRQLQILETEYNNLTEEQKQGSKAADNLIIKMNNQKAAINKTEREISKYSDSLEELKSDADQTGSAIKDMSDDAESGAGGFTILKGALAELVADGIRATIDALKDLAVDGSKAYSQFAAATGTATSEMGKWEDAIQTVYNDNFGESLDDVAQKMTLINQIMGDMSPDEMIKVTEAAMTLEDTFGMDLQETIRGVQNLMTHFGMTSEEALNYISQGAENGLNYTDELGDNIAEYSGKFAEAGYSAEEYFQLLSNGADGGAYNLDKINDAINEVTTRIGDGTIEESLGMFSDKTGEVFKAWQDGKATQKEVIDSIVDDIQGAKTEQDKMNMSVKAFGTMAEDGGIQFIESLTSVGNAYTDVAGKAEQLKNVKYDDVGSALSGLGRTLKSEILQPIVDEIAPVVTDFIQWCIDHMGIVAPIVTGLAAAFGVLAGALAIQGLISGVTKAFALLNTTMLANPMVLIVAAIVGLVAAIVMLWKKNEAFRNFFKSCWEGIKAIFDTVVNSIKAGANKFKEFVDTAVKHIKQLPEKFKTWLTNTLNRVKEFGTNLKTKAVESGKGFIENLINFIKQLPSKIASWLAKAVKKVSDFANKLKSKGKEAATKLVTSVTNGVKKLPAKIKSVGGDVVKGLWNGIGDKVGWIKNKISGFVGNVKSFFKKFFKIESPSKVMRDEVGVYVTQGLAEGMIAGTGSVDDAVDKIGNTILSDFEKINVDAVGENLAKKVADSIKKYNATHKKESADKKSNNAISTASNKLKTSNMTLAEEVKFWETLLKTAKKGSKQYTTWYTNLKNAKKKYNDQLAKLDDDYAKEVKQVYDDLNNSLDDLTQQYLDSVEKRRESIISSLDLFSGIELDEGLDSETLLDNIRQQVDALHEWDYTLDMLRNKDGMNSELLEDLENMNITQLNTLKSIQAMTKEELEEYVRLYEEKNRVAQERATKENEELKRTLDEQAKVLIEDAEKKLDELNKTYKAELKKLGVEVGKQSKPVGEQLVNGITQGILRQKESALQTVRDFVSELVEAAKTDLEINSPSRVFANEVGKWIPAGISEGIKKHANEVYQSVGTMSNGMLNSLSGSGVGGNSTVVNNYNQTINSPKALSRLEIYRQSKNLLGFAGGVK